MPITVQGRVEPVQRTGTENPYTWVHCIGVNAPRGVVIGFIHGTSSTDHVAAVTYGTSPLTRIQRNIDDTTEAGAAELWFVGSGIPTSGQTVTASLNSATTDDIIGMSWTLTSSRNLEVITSSGISLGTVAANPSIAYANPNSIEAYGFGAFYSGLTAHSGSIFAGTGNTKTSSAEMAGNFTGCFIQSNSSGFGTVTIAASAASDDCGFAAIFIGEAAQTTAQAVAAKSIAATPQPIRKIGHQVPAETQTVGLFARSSLRFTQAMTGAMESVTNFVTQLLDFDPSMIGNILYPWMFWGRVKSLQSAPAGPQTYFRSISALDITAPSIGRVLTLLRSMNAPNQTEAFVYKRLGGRLSSSTIGVGNISRAQGIARAIASVVQTVAALTKALGLPKSLSASLITAPGKFIRLFKALAASIITFANLTQTRGLVRTAVSSVVRMVASLTDYATYARSVAAQTITAPVLNKLMSLFRTLAGTSIFKAAITKTSSVSQTIAQAVDSTSQFIAQVQKGISHTLPSQAQFVAAISQTRGLVRSAISSVAQFVASLVEYEIYPRSISAQTIGAPVLNKLMSLFRTLAGTSILKAAITKTSSVAQTIAQAVNATAIFVADMNKRISHTLLGLLQTTVNINKLVGHTITGLLQTIANLTKQTISAGAIQRTLAAVDITAANITSRLSLLRAIAAQAIFNPALSKVSTIAGTILRAITATTIFTATINTRLSLFKTLSATDILTPVVSLMLSLRRALTATTVEAVQLIKGVLLSVAAKTIDVGAIIIRSTMARTLGATVILTPVLSKLMSLFRHLDIQATIIPFIQTASSTVLVVFKTLAAAIVLTPSLIKLFATDAILGTHLAMDRITGFLKGRAGLRRHSSSTEPHNTGKDRHRPTTGSGKRGNGENDAN